MNCEQCGKKIPLYRLWTDTQYCSREHQSIHRAELNRLGLALLMRNAPQPNSDAPQGASLPLVEFLADGSPLQVHDGSLDSMDSCVRPQAIAFEPAY